MSKKIIIYFLIGLLSIPVFISLDREVHAYTSADFAAIPPFVSAGSPPLVLLVLGRNHKLYYEAYNDASDLNGDGKLDVGFKPEIEYYGYFDCNKCYVYDGTDKRFEPTAVTADGKCTGADEWSGNWLNYATMSRMDALRKVLYGGYRSTDTATETVLERAFIPQDAHSWGKEYESPARDGYNIKEYTPYDLPASGTRHMFASTTLSDGGEPLMRALANSQRRIWEWVAKERPVCDNSLATSATGKYDSHPANQLEYQALVDLYGTAEHLQGSGPPANGTGNINGSGNPYGDDDYYLTIFTGKIKIVGAGDYQFAVDGDDAVELIINGTVVTGWYGGHGKCSCTDHNATINLAAGEHIIEFRHQERTGGDNYYLHWNGPDSGNVWQIVPQAGFGGGLKDMVQSVYDVEASSYSGLIDFVVRVQVGVAGMPEDNCKQYANGAYKPIGILQRHGESENMFFGLLTGSYAKNTSGGVLRKNVGAITDEIDGATGQFTAVNGIIKTLDKFRIKGFSYSGYSHNSNCGWIATRAINEGECRMWGNPVAEMMYEGMRYYSGAATPTPDYLYSGTTDDSDLGLPLASWLDPFDPAAGYARCAKPFVMVISDIYPSFDSDQLPGSYFDVGFTGSLGTLNVQNLADTISTTEGINGQYFIGNSAGTFNTACSAKNVTSLSNIRGLCPEEPTKQGSYYSASVSYYGHQNDVHGTADGNQKVTTYAIGLSSPLPKIIIPIQDKTITLVPFAKSVGGYGISSAEGDFQPTNTIVDFFVETLDPDQPTYGKFRINYEDVEQGADHDMDAIVEYEYQVYKADGVTPATDPADGVFVDIKLTSTYASGSIIQHCGYIISGTTKDGMYLEVRDEDTASTGDPDYFLDTPPGVDPGGVWNDGAALPLTTTRRFSPGAAGGTAELIENPLYFAAKWGGFQDSNGNNKPDLNSEWDKDNDGMPDTYFYVVNPLELEEKLNRSFASILERTSSGTAASVISGSRTGEGALYQALFYPSYTDILGNTLTWSGQLHALFVDTYGNFREDTNMNDQLDVTIDRIVQLYFDETEGQTLVRFFVDADGDGVGEGAGIVGKLSEMKTIWDSGKWLAEATAAADRAYAFPGKSRFIWTWVDQNDDGSVSDDGVIDGSEDASSETIRFDPSQLTNRQVLSPYIMAKAFLITSFAGDDNDLELTAVSPGLTGGEVKITYTDPGAANSALLITVAGKEITVRLATDATGAIISTAGQVAAALNSDAAASLLVTAKLPEGEAGAGVVSTMALTGLSLADGAQKLMEYVIGQDKAYWRERDIEVEGAVRTWKLGDIIYSTPAVVAAPAEDFDLIYGDNSYFNYRQAFSNRRQVVYLGSNDGYLHAFNAGFWDRNTRKFDQTKTMYQVEWNAATEQYDIKYTAPTFNPVSYDLGAEMWAFIPQAVLPHLQWLKETEYPHTYMVDLKPKSTDIKFADGSWHTVLICGLRLGGKTIDSTDDFDRDGTVQTSPEEKRIFYSEVFALDVTDPESPPKLLWTYTHENLGLTTSYPTVARVKDKFFVIVGSGPRGTGAYNGESDQIGRIFVLNAETGAMARTTPIEIPESASFLADPAAIDIDLVSEDVNFEVQWSNELTYIGSTSGAPGAWSGRMYRLQMTDSNWNPDDDPNNWTLSTLIEAKGPISSAPNATRDATGNLWIFFGTGRFWSTGDKAECLAACSPDDTVPACLTCKTNSKQWFYGIKEPFDEKASQYSLATVLQTDLADTTGFKVFEGGYVDTNGDGQWDFNFTDFIYNEIQTKQGWCFQFEDEGERTTGQPIVLGGLVTFTTYVPSADVCDYEGNSYLYALYYLTGTAYSESTIGTGTESITEGGEEKKEVLSKTSLGTGVGTAPSMHLGAGSKVMIQSSTGAIITVTEEMVTEVKSGLKAWKEEY